MHRDNNASYIFNFVAYLRNLIIHIFSICKKYDGICFRERNHCVEETCVTKAGKKKSEREEREKKTHHNTWF